MKSILHYAIIYLWQKQQTEVSEVRLVKAKYTIYSPVRVNLLGGWTDQLLWDESAAVINCAVGWHSNKCFKEIYPLRLDRLARFSSAITGRGTGLGISSIYAAMHYVQAFPERQEDYIRFVLEYEKAVLGTEGGWQDQIGGINPGFKLIVTPGDDAKRHRKFTITRRDDHPIIERMVLFDTKVRRNAGLVGDQVRDLLQHDQSFRAHLREVARLAQKHFSGSAEDMIQTCQHSWDTFVSFVPEMTIPKPMPKTELIVGQMLVGAGGGGFGLAFAKDKENRQEVVDLFKKAGFWATIPVLLPGVLLVDGKEE